MIERQKGLSEAFSQHIHDIFHDGSIKVQLDVPLASLLVPNGAGETMLEFDKLVDDPVFVGDALDVLTNFLGRRIEASPIGLELERIAVAMTWNIAGAS